MTEKQIKAVIRLIKNGTWSGSIVPENIFLQEKEEKWGYEDIEIACEFLLKYSLHKMVIIDRATGHRHYKLTDEGLKYQQGKKDIRQFIQQIFDEEAERIRIEKRDEEIKDLQHKRLSRPEVAQQNITITDNTNSPVNIGGNQSFDSGIKDINNSEINSPNKHPSPTPNPKPNSPTGIKQTIQVILQVLAIITAILLAMWAKGCFS